MQSTVNRYANKAKINILDIVFQHGKLYWINTFTGTTTNEYKNSCFFHNFSTVSPSLWIILKWSDGKILKNVQFRKNFSDFLYKPVSSLAFSWELSRRSFRRPLALARVLFLRKKIENQIIFFRNSIAYVINGTVLGRTTFFWLIHLK